MNFLVGDELGQLKEFSLSADQLLNADSSSPISSASTRVFPQASNTNTFPIVFCHTCELSNSSYAIFVKKNILNEIFLLSLESKSLLRICLSSILNSQEEWIGLDIFTKEIEQSIYITAMTSHGRLELIQILFDEILEASNDNSTHKLSPKCYIHGLVNDLAVVNTPNQQKNLWTIFSCSWNNHNPIMDSIFAAGGLDHPLSLFQVNPKNENSFTVIYKACRDAADCYGLSSKSSITDIVCVQHGVLFAICTAQGQLRLYDIRSGSKPLHIFTDVTGSKGRKSLLKLAYNSSKRFFVLADNTGDLYLVDERMPTKLFGKIGNASSGAFTALRSSGNFILTISLDRYCRLFGIEEMSCLVKLYLGQRPSSISLPRSLTPYNTRNKEDNDTQGTNDIPDLLWDTMNRT